MRWIALLLSLVLVPRVMAQEPMMAKMLPTPALSPESQSYTYRLREDGTALVWLRIDSVSIPQEGGEYELTLPEAATGEIAAWYRENACPRYEGDVCSWYGSNPWVEAKVEQVGSEIKLIVPKRSVRKGDEDVPVSLGLVYGMGDSTTRYWWGRQVALEGAASKHYVSGVNVGVDLPDGVYARDKQVGPGGWGAALSEVVSRGAAAPVMDAKGGAGALLDMAGSGQIYHYRQNLAPGERDAFSLMSSTSRWRLFYREILTALGYVVAIAVVLSLLLYLVIGRKPWWWYCLVTVLLVALAGLGMGLWVSSRFGMGSDGRGGYGALEMAK